MFLMKPRSKVAFIWEEPVAAIPYTTGVSLHSHTSASIETLSFIHQMGTSFAPMRAVFNHYEKRSRERHGVILDFISAHWRPPLQPRMAFDLECGQIRRLGLEPMVSLTDHDTIEAPLLLRTLTDARRIPVSVEWSAPYGRTEFHLGIHNLPSDDAVHLMQRMAQFTACPSDAALHRLLSELNAIPQILIVLNHPLWDLYKIGLAAHTREVHRFLDENGHLIHALELNGLRHVRENRDVVRLAHSRSHLVVSGGDRHGLEPNANINLTNATSFTEFVHEVRIERRSHVLFMEQYRRPWEQRILDSTLNAITDFPEFSLGWQRWDERAFHQDNEGNLRPISELWATGRPPFALRVAIRMVQALRSRTFAKAFGVAFLRINGARMSGEILNEIA
jgi:hypothetical protein